jgi:hypothetical protein
VRTVVIIATLAAFVAAPALAQKTPRSDVVKVGDKRVGQDPDSHVRFELTRDWQVYAGGGSE